MKIFGLRPEFTNHYFPVSRRRTVTTGIFWHSISTCFFRWLRL
jgi:hypothetical protein